MIHFSFLLTNLRYVARQTNHRTGPLYFPGEEEICLVQCWLKMRATHTSCTHTPWMHLIKYERYKCVYRFTIMLFEAKISEVSIQTLNQSNLYEYEMQRLIFIEWSSRKLENQLARLINSSALTKQIYNTFRERRSQCLIYTLSSTVPFCFSLCCEVRQRRRRGVKSPPAANATTCTHI